MVHVEGPSGDDLFPRERRGRLNDHEQRAVDRFRCPSCGSPLDLLERERDTQNLFEAVDEQACELTAACRQCLITFTQDDWHKRMRAA